MPAAPPPSVSVLQSQNWKIKLGGPNSEVKQKIFGLNSAHLYGLDIKMAQGSAFTADKIAAIKQEYLALGGDRSNACCGYVAKKDKVA